MFNIKNTSGTSFYQNNYSIKREFNGIIKDDVKFKVPGIPTNVNKRTVATQTDSNDIIEVNSDGKYVFAVSDDDDDTMNENITPSSSYLKTEPLANSENQVKNTDLVSCSQVAKSSLDRLKEKLNDKLSQIPIKTQPLSLPPKKVQTPTISSSIPIKALSPSTPVTPLATSTPRNNNIRFRLELKQPEEQKVEFNDSFDLSFNDDDFKIPTPNRASSTTLKATDPRPVVLCTNNGVIEMTASQRRVTRSMSRIPSTPNSSTVTEVKDLRAIVEKSINSSSTPVRSNPLLTRSRLNGISNVNTNTTSTKNVQTTSTSISRETVLPSTSNLSNIQPKQLKDKFHIEQFKVAQPVDSFDDDAEFLASIMANRKNTVSTAVVQNENIDNKGDVKPTLADPYDSFDDSDDMPFDPRQNNGKILVRESLDGQITKKEPIDFVQDSMNILDSTKEVPETPPLATISTTPAKSVHQNGLQTTPKSTRKRQLEPDKSNTPAFKKVKSMLSTEPSKIVNTIDSPGFKKTKSFQPPSTNFNDFEDDFYDDSPFE